MNYKSFPIGVHTNENSIKVLEGIVQHDNANLFQIQLYDGTDAFDFTGYSVINVAIVRPDETTVTDVWTMIINEAGDIEYVLADEDTTGDVESHTFLAIQYLDPANGRITLQVGGEATAQVGLHRMVIEIYADDVVLTTARINYNVVETVNKVGASILQESDDYIALRDLLSSCSQIITAEAERANQEAARVDQEKNRQASVTKMLADLSEYVSTLTQKLEIATAAADRAQSWAMSSQAIAVDQLPQALKDAIYNAEASASTINDLSGRLSIIENKTNRMDLSSADGYVSLPVVTASTIGNYFATNNTPGAVVLNTSDNALYVGTGNGRYTVVSDPDAFKGVWVNSTTPSSNNYIWFDSGNQLKIYKENEWKPVKTIAVFG